MKLLLDTCIWLDYIWQKKATNHRSANQSKKLIDRVNGDRKYEIVLSPFLIREISSHYKDWFLLQKVIKNGFSFNDFKKEKHKHSLQQEEKEEIDSIIEEIGSINNVNVLVTSDLNVREVERILLLEGEYDFDVYDAIHFSTAVENECDVIVTRDNGFRRAASKYSQVSQEKIDCQPPKSLIKSI